MAFQTKLGDCVYQTTSKSCVDNAFCPLPNSRNFTLCQPCSELLPGYSCNCQLNLHLNCAGCKGISCSKCIQGYALQNGECILSNTCNGNIQECSHEHFCPIGTEARSCKQCSEINSAQSCNCAGTEQPACLTCSGTFCTSCLETFTLLNGSCSKDSEFGPCTSAADCQFGMFCRNEICLSCIEIPEEEYCNCGDLLKSCKRCDGGSKCLECTGIMMFSLGASEDLKTFPSAGCKSPGVCTGGSSNGCKTQFYCDASADKCFPCDNKITTSFGCNCGTNQQQFGARFCSSKTKQSLGCFKGYILVQRPEVGFQCSGNFCDRDNNGCQNGYSCPAGPVGMTECELCQVGSTEPCNCFSSSFCMTCNLDTKLCDLCLNGFVKTEGFCVPKTNICGKDSTSLTCDGEFACNGVIGDDCVPCQQLEIGKSCNCDVKLAENCLECSGKQCGKCREEFILEDGRCIPNTCANPINTKNCYFGYYCHNDGVPETICLSCGSQQQDCNCGLLTGCQQCGSIINTCVKCFNGYQYDPQTQLCELKANICDFSNGSSICSSGNRCEGVFGDECIPCTGLVLGQFCKCGQNLLENCVHCENEQCSTCLEGYFPVNGQCISNTCFSGGPSSTCAFGNFCPPGDGRQMSCEICEGDNTVTCQCGANNCITCGSLYNSCKTCIFGYILDSDDQCVLKNNICDNNAGSTLCQSGFFCNSTFGNPCVECTNLKANQSCNCNQTFIPNCVQCAGKTCFSCLKGYLILPDRTCIQNGCDAALSSSTCFLKYQCDPGSKIGDNCKPCSTQIESQCSCGTALNCKTCGVLHNTCEVCLYGYTFDAQTLQCIKITDQTKNICDEQGSSKRCESQYFCAGIYGDTCQFCSTLITNKSCNCNGSLQENCVFCEEQECKFCIEGYYLNEQKCVVNTCGPNIDTKCAEGYYCPATTTESTCEQCQTQDIQCNCGTAQNCQVCSLQSHQCLLCLQGYNFINGQCVLKLDCLLSQDCNLGYFCNINTCDPCEIQVVPCNCGSGQNCQNCGRSGTCSSCLLGWTPNTESSCSIPTCAEAAAPGYYCEKPGITGPCPEGQNEIAQMQNTCNCGQALHCANCLEGNVACKTCMKGSVMINGVCFIQTPGFTGNCKESGDSVFCMPGNACIVPEVCSSCEGVSTGFTCNCDGNLILNCTECNLGKCEKCFTGFIQMGGDCIPACYINEQCLVGELCDLDINICGKCDGTTVCNCGESLNCTDCNEKTCLSCIEGYKIGGKGDCGECDDGWTMNEENQGECIVSVPEENKTLDLINYVGIGIGVVSLIGMGIGISIFYAKKPKKFSIQHNFMSPNK